MAKKKQSGTDKFINFFTKQHYRNLKAAISIVTCFTVLFFITAMLYSNHVLNSINYGEGYQGDIDATFEDVVDENLSYQAMYDITDAETLNALIKSWATNGGEKLYSKNVINVLLIGEDNDDGSHRSDSMILLSLNKKTKKIILTSFLRDSYTYMNISGSERFDKTNHTYAWGGTQAVIETLENNYKIDIDHYVTVDFKAFTKAINAIGGIDVPVTEDEAKYMNATTHFNDFKSGNSVHLDGAHALIFSRIRHLDGEVERTDRQKLVIKALVNKAKTLNPSQITTLCDTILPLISTDYTKNEIVALGTQAIARNWMSYPITAQTQPEEKLRVGVTMRTWSYSNLFVWIVDYPMAAQNLQKSIYGTTNIQIDEANHKSALNMLNEVSTTAKDFNYNDYDYDRYNYNYKYEEETSRSILNILPSITRNSTSSTRQYTTRQYTTRQYTTRTTTNRDGELPQITVDPNSITSATTGVKNDNGTTKIDWGYSTNYRDPGTTAGNNVSDFSGSLWDAIKEGSGKKTTTTQKAN